jgi:hypothetical protein
MGRAYSLTIILNVVVRNTHRPEPNSLHVSSMSVPGMTMFRSSRSLSAVLGTASHLTDTFLSVDENPRSQGAGT